MNLTSELSHRSRLATQGGPHWEFSTMVEVARWRAAQHGEQTAYTFLLDGEEQTATFSFAQLDARARAIAGELQSRGKPGQRVLVVLDPGLDYVATLFGCFYAGAIAVPVYPPDPFRIARTLPRLQAIFRGAECQLLASTSNLLGGESNVLRQTCPRGVVEIDKIATSAADAWKPVASSGDDIALLQYTSGTTGAPRGVAISHDNLQYNMRAMEQLLDVPDAVVMHWLPPYHDLGLIGGVFLPLFAGRQVVLMSPLDFMRRPVRWLEAISRFRATTSASPNFGYELCTRKITEADCEGLDLSCWQIAASGAEQVRGETLDHFCERFGPYGFRREAFVPAYGMAETTLMVSIGRVHQPPLECEYQSQDLAESNVTPRNGRVAPVRRLVGCGPPGPEIDLRIVDPQTCESAPGVGEVWVRCPGVAKGYWRNPEATAECFNARLASGESGFLRTGDLGFVDQGELFIVGRLKETLILGGRNYYPQDIELAIQAQDAAFKTDGGAVVAVEVDNEERLAVFQEVHRPRRQDLDKLLTAARETVIEETLQEPYAVVLLPVGELPKTSSGKTRRGHCWSEFQAGVMSPLRSWRAGQIARPSLEATLQQPPATATEKWLADCWRAVLDLPEVFRNDSFLALGGQSLQLIEMLQRVAEKTGKQLHVKELFERPTLAQVAQWIDDSPEAGVNEIAGATADFLQHPQPLSEPQQRLWMLEQLGLRGGANVPLAIELGGSIDRDRLNASLRTLCERHQMLRTGFAFEGDQPVQRLQTSATIDVETLTPDATVDRSKSAVAWALDQPFVWAPFDLGQPPLARAAVVNWSQEKQVLLLVLHHLIGDGGALDSLAHELAAIYNGATPLAPQRDYWDFLAGRAARSTDTDIDYWRDRLAGLPPAINLPLEPNAGAIEPTGIAVQSCSISSELTQAIARLASQRGVTPFMVYLSAYQLLLSRYSQDERVVVGVAQAGRDDSAWRDTLGCFIDAVPLAADVSGGPSYGEFLSTQRDAVLDDFTHAGVAWEELLAAAGVQRIPGRMPLAQAFFLYENAPAFDGQLGRAPITSAATDYRGLGVYDVTLVVNSGAHGADVRLVHDPARLSDDMAHGMAAALARLLESIVRTPDAPLTELAVLPDKESARLAHLATGRVVEQQPETALACIERQARANPTHMAVACGDRSMTYQQLSAQADLIAQGLRERHVSPGDRVGLLLRRSPEMLAAMLGVWKVGAAYVPLDPDYPASRLKMMTDDCRPVAVLTDDGLVEHAPDGVQQVIALPTLLSRSPIDNAPPPVGGEAAYAIYTSGSTGKPKGVVVGHAAVANFLRSFAHDLVVTPEDRVLAATTISFDISVLELFLPLAVGATVVLADSDAVGDGGRLGRLIDSAGVTLVQGTPSAYRMMLATGWKPSATQRLLAGGEELTPDVARELLASAGRLWNVYGPTETTIWSTIDEVTSADGRVSIGRPIDNTTCYLLDSHQRLTPEGVWGELAIGGRGLAEGYFERVELTAERFPTVTLPDGKQERLYLTGDRARWRADGRLEFGGRVDNQVKVRGHRIELGEIELALRDHPGIAEAAVITVEDPLGMALAAYFVSHADEPPCPADLRTHLSGSLPDYMIPAAFVRMDDALPRTGSGKIDRARLPKPEGCRLARTAEHIAPRTPIEERLAEWWREVLRLDEVGVLDNFFELGGHSLSVMQLTVRIRDNLGVELPLRDAYQQPTIAQWAEMILAAQVATDDAVDPELLAQLEEMSDEEAVTLLEKLGDKELPPLDREVR